MRRRRGLWRSLGLARGSEYLHKDWTLLQHRLQPSEGFSPVSTSVFESGEDDADVTYVAPDAKRSLYCDCRGRHRLP